MASTSCPNCSAPLSEDPALFGPGKPGRHCRACQTSFADGATAQGLFELAGIPLGDVKQAIDRGAPKSKGAPRTCPTCSKPLARFVLKGIELDLCVECGTTAFDPGELWRLTSGKLGTAPSSPKAGVFEMLWDCEHCDTRSLLGKTNRYCPVCGAPQDPRRRRFPPPGEETAANTTYDGADHACPACSTPNGAKAVHCRHCGSPMDGSAAVKRVSDQVDGRSVEVAATPPPPQPRRLWPWIAGAVLVLFCGVCGVAVTRTKASKATVSGHEWSRSVDVERFGPVKDSAWCDELPSSAYDVSRSKKKRSTNKVADGETCTTRNVDRGDGTFERKQECKPKYKEEPVFDQHCDFKVDRWSKARSVVAKGSLADTPAWPDVTTLRGGSSVGSEREGARHEAYTVRLKGPGGEAWACDLSQAQWSGLKEGTTHDVKVRVMTGGIDCGSLQAR